MNLLLHFHLAAEELEAGAAGVGAMLPDLWRMADRRVRVRRARVARAPEGLERLCAGVQHHLAIDRWFHASSVLTQGERELAAALPSLRGSRLRLFAHVAWEMCLDSALLSQLTLEVMLGRLRAAFAELDEAAPARLASLHGADRRLGAAERRRFEARLAELCGALCEGAWLGGYLDGEGLAWRLEGVRARLGLAPLGEQARRAVAGVLEAQRLRAAPALEMLLDQARKR